MKYTIVVEDESFGDQKLMIPMACDGSETFNEAVVHFHDCIIVAQAAIAERRAYPIINSQRLDGQPTAAHIEALEKYGKSLIQ